MQKFEKAVRKFFLMIVFSIAFEDTFGDIFHFTEVVRIIKSCELRGSRANVFLLISQTKSIPRQFWRTNFRILARIPCYDVRTGGARFTQCVRNVVSHCTGGTTGTTARTRWRRHHVHASLGRAGSRSYGHQNIVSRLIKIQILMDAASRVTTPRPAERTRIRWI